MSMFRSNRGLFSRQQPQAPPPPPKRHYHPIQPRAPQPAALDKPSLTGLGTDILTLIVDVLQDAHPRTVLDVALVSSYFHNLARYSQHRTITLTVPRDPDWQQHIHDRLHYTEEQGLLPAIREVEVINPASLRDDVLEHICRLMPKMTGLRNIQWPDNILQPQMLQALNARPSSSVNLHTQFANHYGHIKEGSNLHTLQSSHNLRSLRVQGTYVDAKGCLAITQPLKQILLTCPNLRSLSLDISLPRSGCVVHGEPPEYCGFGFVEGEKPLAALEELVLVAYTFGHEPRPSGASDIMGYFANLGVTQSLGYRGTGPEIEYWAQHFDWSRLRRLEVGSGQAALELLPKLTVLKEVAVQNARRGSEEWIGRLFREVPTELESITVPSIASIGLEALARHGAALRRLQIHRNEDYHGKWRASAITATDLRKIRDTCPLISDLAIDLARHNDNDWPYDALNVLATFPRLRKLAIYFELGVDNNAEPCRPYVTFSAAAMLYRYLLQHSLSTPPPRLEVLKLHSGSPPPMGHGYPSRTAFWPQSQSMEFTCALSPRDDEAREGGFGVSCRGLSGKDCEVEDLVEQKKRLLILGEEGGGVGEGRGQRGLLKLALEGPTPVGEWKGRY